MNPRIGLIALFIAGCCAWTVLLVGSTPAQHDVGLLPAVAFPLAERIAAAQESAQGLETKTRGSDGPRTTPSAPGHFRCVNVNTADKVRLTELPGIGPVTAERIVSSRAAEGTFACAEDLLRVKGIGPGRLQEIRNRICF